MFDKILIANRGEIAVRLMRACRQLGVRSVAVYSSADREALHVRMADEAFACGGARASESYLDAERMVEIARESGAEAVHPGYGFLSENGAFADACEAAGIKFIGPSATVLRAMGDKITSRRAMEAAGVPIVPGATDALDDAETRAKALEIGLPVMVKASAGGGGRGLRLVAEESDLDAAIERARSEAETAFGDGSLYVEKFLSGPRHIEVQILADAHGRVLHLGDRECSIQRRHQKLIEEAPANRLPDDVRSALHAAAVDAARAVGYEGAGTVEFLIDDQDDFYFLEMNTRIQVEHAISEEITGVDLVCEMIKIAAGEPLSFEQNDIEFRGHAIEARVYAEDPDKNFMPSPGRITHWRPAEGPGVRVDAGVEAGSEVSIHYDPMVAKLVVWGPTREVALARLGAALHEFQIGGIKTSLPFHKRALEVPAFLQGSYTTAFVDTYLADAVKAAEPALHARVAALAAVELVASGVVEAGANVTLKKKGQVDVAVAASLDDAGARLAIDGVESVWDLRRPGEGVLTVIDAGVQTEVLVECRGKAGVEVVLDGRRHVLKWQAE